MHGYCAFLIEHDVEPEGTLRERYAARHCGADQFWAPIEQLRRDGQTVQLAKGVEPLSTRFPVAERWPAMQRWMIDEAAADFVATVRGAAPHQRAAVEAAFPSDEASQAHPRSRALDIGLRMSTMLRALDGTANEMTLRALAKAERIMRLLAAAEDPPFSRTLASPHIYRAFDLRKNGADPSMYIVDMHA